MDKNRTPDRIDLELSKTYFASGKRKKRPSSSLKAARIRLILISLAVLVCLICLGVYFFTRNRVTFSINVDVEPRGKESRTQTQLKSPKETAPKEIAATGKYDLDITPQQPDLSSGKNLYDFENGTEGWEIPAWEFDEKDYAASSLQKCGNFASKGSGSLELYTDFSGENWKAALIEIQQYLDLNEYAAITVDVYLPPGCPEGLRGKIILSTGDSWEFVEMSRSIRLKPGEWTTIIANISEGSIDWKKTKVDKKFKSDVRKIAVRIEAEKNMIYSGPVYIDNVTVYPPENTRS